MNTQEKENKVVKVGKAAEAVGELYKITGKIPGIDKDVTYSAIYTATEDEGDQFNPYDEFNEEELAKYNAWKAGYGAGAYTASQVVYTSVAADYLVGEKKTRDQLVELIFGQAFTQSNRTADEKARVAEAKKKRKEEVKENKAALQADPEGWFENRLNEARVRAFKFGYTGGLKTGHLTTGHLTTGNLTPPKRKKKKKK